MKLTDSPFQVYYAPADDPLHTFYLPALSASVQYDRSAGYFRSSALAAAAAGIVRLIGNGGRMRLLVGADLSQPDVDAINQGYDLRQVLAPRMVQALDDLEDALARQRIEALAWMVASGHLEIKVVLPLDGYGRPIPGPEARDYYHVKEGVFTDTEGNQVAFVGSVNESGQAWQHNYETLLVSVSWESGRERDAVRHIRQRFTRLWEGSEPSWLAVDLPDAVRQRLIRYAPDRPPDRDALERAPELPALAGGVNEGYQAIPTEERLLFQFLRDAPHLLDIGDLAAQTAPIRPWPHQLDVARTVNARFPDRVMLCDEVGLGKTIEAGLILRHLLLSGRVKRCLILTPASVLKQWQEELYEKFNLDLPRYDKGVLLDRHDHPLGPPLANPWQECDLFLASSHLARRRERVPDLVNARPWDLLIVDEAHHARRKDFLQPQYRPNRLLTLLNALRDAGQYRALMLMTATPMQVHPVEVWDLLMTLGLSGRWAVSDGNYLRFYQELRSGFGEVDWDFILDMVHDSLGPTGQIDANFQEAIRRTLGAALTTAICELPRQSPIQRQETLRSLPDPARSALYELARRHTPLRHFVFRNTRSLLRTYQQQGILDAIVPRRKPHIRRIAFRADEAALYDRITDYITHFYRKYEAERRGLGFVMTVYRRRLTSSFFAVRRSLERRRDWLRGAMDPEEALELEDLLDLDDEWLGDSDQEVEEVLTASQRQNFQAELDYLDDFIGDLRTLSQADSKLTFLKEELETLFRQRPTVLVFTQYTDTMDYLRGQLVEVYGSGVACYSGRGGEVWNGITFVSTTKEEVKTRFRAGEIKILLATESASEGLNLQTCGVLINYDMPWNPMRVEQRIGRIDRIGQEFDEVWIHNYFYKDSIEDRIYHALEDRILWFEDVVGELQPILAEVGLLTQRLAMLPTAELQRTFQREIDQLRQKIEEARLQTLNMDMDDPGSRTVDSRLTSPVTLADLERILTTAGATAHLFTPHPAIPDAYMLHLNRRETAITFSREQFDEHPDTLHFLSYGSPLLDALLSSVPAPEAHDLAVLRFTAGDESSERAQIGWYSLAAALPSPVRKVADLHRALSAQLDTAARSPAEFDFQKRVAAEQTNEDERVEAFHLSQRRTLQFQAQDLLCKAALVEIARGQQLQLFDTDTYPAGFSDSAITGLERHKKPWTWMLKYGYFGGLRVSDDDPYWAQVQGLDRDALKRIFDRLTAEAIQVRERMRSLD